MLPDQVPEWDGKIETLPEIGKVFIYKGQRYKRVSNGYRQVVVFAGGPEICQPCLLMTARVAGGNMDYPPIDILTKSGRMTREEIATALEAGDIKKILNEIKVFLEDIPRNPNPQSLRSLGITRQELAETRGIVSTILMLSATRIPLSAIFGSTYLDRLSSRRF